LRAREGADKDFLHHVLDGNFVEEKEIDLFHDVNLVTCDNGAKRGHLAVAYQLDQRIG